MFPITSLLLLLFSYSSVESANILVKPYSYGMCSRFRDVIKMSEILSERGHNLTVLLSDEDQKYMNHIENVTFLTFPHPKHTPKLNEMETDELFQSSLGHIVDQLYGVILSVCSEIYKSEALLEILKNSEFDVVLADVADPCGRIVVSMLDIPTVGYTSHGPTLDASFSPRPFAYVPALMSTFSNDMVFTDRFKNAIVGFVFNYYVTYLYGIHINAFLTEHNITLRVDYRTAFANSLVISGTDFIFEYPHPVMPNVVYAGGWYVDHPRPLTDSLKSFVDSAKGPVIYVSFGTLVSKSGHSQMKMLANVFAQFTSYSFVWKYTGSKINVTDNVMIMKWVPQNDLLGHPKLSLFITHCGVHSSYETIYNSVPVIALPLFVDQPSNAKRLTDRLGMGIQLNFYSFTEEDMKKAILKVLSDSKYKKNAKKASSLYSDQQTSPRSRVIYSIEYVARQNGSVHLASLPLYNLNIFQLYGMDVLVSLLLVLGVSLLLVFYAFVYIEKTIMLQIKRAHMKEE